MPIISRRQRSPDLRKSADSRDSFESLDSTNNLWVVDGDLPKPPAKAMDFHLQSMATMPTRLTKSQNNLRIHTQPKSDLFERYQSSEEEASPSPTNFNTKTSKDVLEKDDSFLDEIDEAVVMAVAVPLVSVGRPKMIDIARIAPIQKRKRPVQRSFIAANGPAKRLGEIDENKTYAPTKKQQPVRHSYDKDIFALDGTPTLPPKRIDSLRVAPAAPDSWLPEEDESVVIAEEGQELFPNLSSGSTPTTYAEYDPFSLNPPRLVSSPTFGRPGSSTPTNANRNSSSSNRISGSSINSNNNINIDAARSWTGLSRKISIAKRSNPAGAAAAEYSGTMRKKSKMIARPAGEREALPSIPPFPFE
ncbi:hypothetical protein MMC09_006417 [Bachmanniomyces sp. S44760]|nr:hypothetical protein [Bachmanniomyces sp. S44760]